MTAGHGAEMLPGAEQWCQRWRRGTHTWRLTSEGGFDPARYTVVPLRTAPLTRFIEDHHYSHKRASTVLGYALVDLWPDPDADGQWLDLEPHRAAARPAPGPAHRRGQIVGALTLGNPMNKHVLLSPFPDLPRSSSPWSSIGWSCWTRSTRRRSRSSAGEPCEWQGNSVFAAWSPTATRSGGIGTHSPARRSSHPATSATSTRPCPRCR